MVQSFTIPNFVDTERFSPGRNPELRARLGIPESAFVVLSVAAIKKSHKRIDYLISEFAKLLSHDTAPPSDVPRSTSHVPQFFLLIAGARTNETGELIAMADELLPGCARVLPDMPHHEMPGLYRAADVFALCSLKEMMPIAVLEAMASGLPVIANRHPVLQWMVGEGDRGHGTGDIAHAVLPGGECIDMGCAGALAATMIRFQAYPIVLKAASEMARAQAVERFSKKVVAALMIEMYQTVMVDGDR